MVKKLICPKCGGDLGPFGELHNFMQCLICGAVVSKESAEEHAVEVSDGEET